MKIPKRYAKKRLLKYILKRVIIQTRIILKLIKQKRVDYDFVYLQLQSLQGYLNVAHRLMLTLSVMKRTKEEIDKSKGLNKKDI